MTAPRPLMALLRALAASRAGAALVEFAFVAPVALAMLFSLIEGGRIYWIKQTLNDVAYATARCMSVSSACDTAASQKAYAVTRARDLAVSVEENDVTVIGGTTCKSAAGSNSVSITHRFNSPMGGFLPFVPEEISATACFPVLS